MRGALSFTLGIILGLIAVFIIFSVIAWVGAWLLGVVTAGAVVLGFWQAFAGVTLLSIIGTLISKS